MRRVEIPAVIPVRTFCQKWAAAARVGLWTLRPAVDPGLDERAGERLRARRGRAALARVPRRGDEIVVLGDMLLQRREVAPAVAVLVLELAADVADRLALPAHRDRREAPPRRARNAGVARDRARKEIDRAIHVAGLAGCARN